MKDLFSDVSVLYQQARPIYPHSIIQEILKHVPNRQFVWDCGAGSGQFTQLLVPYFEQIVATDLSSQQLHRAAYFENVSYQVQQAEQTSFADQSFDLITVAQAIHWFDYEKFYTEVKRTLKKDGVLAVLGYGLIKAKDVELNRLIQQLYFETLKGYWDVERAHIDHAYQTLPFPFDEIAAPTSEMTFSWSAEQLLGYLNTWTGLKHYRNSHNANHNRESADPLLAIVNYLNQTEKLIDVQFPVFMRIGKLKALKRKNKISKNKSPVNMILKRVSLGLKAFADA